MVRKPLLGVLFGAISVAAVLLSSGLGTAAPPKPAAGTTEAKKKESPVKGRFLRLTRDKEKNPLALEVAIVRLQPKDGRPGPTVDLVGAVHVGEKAYYDQLNREFAGYDAVLYELVTSDAAKIRQRADHGDNPISFLQKTMQNMLELQFQLDAVDYTRKNFVHADMSPKQFAETMEKRGETIWGIFLRLMLYGMANQKEGDATETDLLLALFDPHRALALKRILAEQFQDMEGSLLAINGPSGSTIISERNKVALEVLRKELAAGKRKLAIFYGAGHMPDMQERLEKDFHLVPVNTRWLVAWNLKEGEEGR